MTKLLKDFQKYIEDTKHDWDRTVYFPYSIQ
jgi:hypothetical protein